MKPIALSQVIDNGIQQLSRFQKEDGSFLSLSSCDENDFSNASTFHTTFLSSLILTILAQLPSDKKIAIIRKRLAEFLLIQKSTSWSWNYWTRESQETKDFPYPDDLDDTFCALAGLSHYDKRIISGDVFANIVKILTFTESKEGGPYRTWLVKKNSSKKWLDVDIAVNANIAYFLSLHEITLPNLDRYFEKAIKENNLLSPYYPSLYAPVYFLSRFYKGKQLEKIRNILLEKRGKNGVWENPLKTALAVLTLLNCGVDPKEIKQSIQYLVDNQQNGMWKAYGFCIDPSRDGKQYYAGSQALTTAICLIVLEKIRLIEKRKNIQTREKKEKKYFSDKIIKQVHLQIDSAGKEVNGKTEILLKRILKNDTTSQIPLMPYYFYQSIKNKNKKITKHILIQLCTANILGWIAYTIYDDFLDEEGNPLFLPTATIALRKLTSIYDTFSFKKKRIQKLFHSILNTIDNANTWEVDHCRIKNGACINTNFEQLANKSIGHGMGPFTLLLLSGYTQESREFKLLYTFFKQYLITKQLNDDAHDWEEDLKKGHLTPVLSLLLKKAEEKGIVKKIKNLRELFWREIIQEVCALIYDHAKKAKFSLRKLSVIIDPTMLELLLEKNVLSADKALEEQKEMNAFLQTYTS